MRPSPRFREVLSKDKAREHKNLTLYVAGHTDTVGNAGYNLKLSQARAQSLGRWFRQRGVRIPIAFEGFGETALKVQTPIRPTSHAIVARTTSSRTIRRP